MKHASVLLLTLSLIGLLALAFSYRSIKAYPPENGTIIELNTTLIPRESLVPIEDARVHIVSDYYGILPWYLMELTVNMMVCGWAAFAAACSAIYFLTKRFVWSRKTTVGIALLTVVGAVVLTFVTWLYQVKPYMLDAEEVYFGYPFVWLSSSRSVFWGSAEWAYNIQWYGLIGNVAFHMWIFFAVAIAFTILPKTISKLVHFKRI